jgi:hypothetical protein
MRRRVINALDGSEPFGAQARMEHFCYQPPDIRKQYAVLLSFFLKAGRGATFISPHCCESLISFADRDLHYAVSFSFLPPAIELPVKTA